MSFSSWSSFTFSSISASSFWACWASSMEVETTPMKSVSSTRPPMITKITMYTAAQRPVGLGSVQRSDQYAPGYSYLSQPYMLMYMMSVQSSKVLALKRESMAM